MINPLGIATGGLLPGSPLSIASSGFLGFEQIASAGPGGGSTIIPRSRIVITPSERHQVDEEQLLREDEELIALIVAAVQNGVIP